MSLIEHESAQSETLNQINPKLDSDIRYLIYQKGDTPLSYQQSYLTKDYIASIELQIILKNLLKCKTSSYRIQRSVQNYTFFLSLRLKTQSFSNEISFELSNNFRTILSELKQKYKAFSKKCKILSYCIFMFEQEVFW